MTDSVDEKDIVKTFPNVSFPIWAKLYGLPVQRVQCLECKQLVITSRPFILEHPKTNVAVVGLTTDQNGEHDCRDGLGISVAKMISNKVLNIAENNGDDIL